MDKLQQLKQQMIEINSLVMGMIHELQADTFDAVEYEDLFCRYRPLCREVIETIRIFN